MLWLVQQHEKVEGPLKWQDAFKNNADRLWSTDYRNYVLTLPSQVNRPGYFSHQEDAVVKPSDIEDWAKDPFSESAPDLFIDCFGKCT